MMIPTMLSAIPVSPANMAAAKIFCILTCQAVGVSSHTLLVFEIVRVVLTCWQSLGTLCAHFWWNLKPQVRQQKPATENSSTPLPFISFSEMIIIDG